jgi:hypothetical protein
VQLPNDSIGISDILAWMDCARRMSFSMKRWTEEGEPPEAATNPSTAYGSCFHDMVEAIEKHGLSDEQAIQVSFDRWGWMLDPETMERLEKDLAIYRSRDVVGVETVLNEGEIRVPLMERDGRMIYFRGKIDRLYRFRANPGIWLHKDFKSSAWRRSKKEVDQDPQMWAYNWALHEYFPEIERLIQQYDQLNYGIETTEKSAAKRDEIAKWLRRQVTAILNDEDYDPRDGLLKPKFNEWCPWCPIMEDCKVIPQLTDYAQRRIALLSPHVVSVAKLNLDATGIETYVKQLDNVGTAKKTLDVYEKNVKGLLRHLPDSERKLLGWKLSPRSSDVWDDEAQRRVHEILGDDYYRLVSFTKSQLNSLFDDDPRAAEIRSLSRKEGAGEQMRRSA